MAAEEDLEKVSMALELARKLCEPKRRPVIDARLVPNAIRQRLKDWLELELVSLKAPKVEWDAPVAQSTRRHIDAAIYFEDASRLCIETMGIPSRSAISASIDHIRGISKDLPLIGSVLVAVAAVAPKDKAEVELRLQAFSREQSGFLYKIVAVFENTVSSSIEVSASDRNLNSSSADDALKKPEGPIESSDSETRPEVLSDEAIVSAAEDQLGFGRYARALYALIDGQRTQTPLTFAIHAPWGSGKTSLARLIAEPAQKYPSTGGTAPHQVFWFNAWLHDEGNVVHASFVSALAQYCNRQRPFYKRLVRPISQSLLTVHERRQRRYRVTFVFFFLIVALFYFLAPDHLPNLPNLFLTEVDNAERGKAFYEGGILVLLAAILPAAYSFFTKFWEVGAAMGAYALDPKTEAQSASLGKVRAEICNLIVKTVPPGSRLIVIIDDLERCRPPGCIDLLEAINQLFDKRGLPVVFILLADMTALAAAATVKYENLSKHYMPNASASAEKTETASGRHNFGRMYLEKLVQLQFDLPRLSKEQLTAWAERLQAPQRQFSELEYRSLDSSSLMRELISDPQIRLTEVWQRFRESGFQPWWKSGWSDWFLRIVYLPFYLPMLGSVFFSLTFCMLRYLRRKNADISTWIRDAELSEGKCRSWLFGFGWILVTASLLLPTIVGLVYVALTQYPIINLKIFGHEPEESEFAKLIAKDVFEAVTVTVMVLTFSALLISVAILLWRFTAKHLSDRRRTRAAFELRKDLRSGNSDSKAYSEFMDESTLEHIQRRAKEEKSQDLGDRFGKAREAALRFSRGGPRALKRLINRVRLAVYLTEEDKISSGSIGKWAAFQESWPALASAVSSQVDASQFLKILEAAAEDSTTLDEELKKVTPGLRADKHLIDCLTIEPRLSRDIDRLIQSSAAASA